ncbi:hypothetical protein HMI54_009408, partial [Coelomomyces lativittatus]
TRGGGGRGGGGGGGGRRPVATTSTPSSSSTSSSAGSASTSGFVYEASTKTADSSAETGGATKKDDPYGKTVCSSVAVIPPPEAWPPLEAIRRIYDTGFVRWPPHVNMLYPFLHNFQFPEASTKLAAALADFPSFTVTLKPDSEALVKLQTILEATFPTCDDLGRINEHGFVPHLSVANDTKNGKQAEDVIALLSKDWKELSFPIREVYFISRLGPKDSPFDIRYAIPLADPPAKGEIDSTPSSAPSSSSDSHQSRAGFTCRPIVQSLDSLDAVKPAGPIYS